MIRHFLTIFTILFALFIPNYSSAQGTNSIYSIFVRKPFFPQTEISAAILKIPPSEYQQPDE